MHDSIDFPTGKCAVNRIFRYICFYSPERFCRPETTIHNDYENCISIFIIPVAFRQQVVRQAPADRQGATLRLDPAAAFARRADRRRRLQSRRIGSRRAPSPESFEPTPRQYVALNRSKLVFNVGLIDFEQNLLRDFPDREKLVNLEPGHPAARRELRTRTYTRTDRKSTRVRRARTRHRPSHLDLAARTETDGRQRLRRASHIVSRLGSLYGKLRKTARPPRLARYGLCEALRQADVHTIVIYHPALTYYAADYGLEQLAVEHDGKEPSARHLARLIEEARRKKVRRVFYQAQYPGVDGQSHRRRYRRPQREDRSAA